MPEEMPPPATSASAANITEIAGYIRQHSGIFPPEKQLLLDISVQNPLFRINIKDFSETLELVRHLAYSNRLKVVAYDVIEVAELLQSVRNGLGRSGDPRSLQKNAATLLKIILSNHNVIDKTIGPLFKTRCYKLSKEWFDKVSNMMTATRERFPALQQHTSSLLEVNGDNFDLRRSIRKVQLFGPYYVGKTDKQIEMNQLIRACLHVVKAFDLSKSTSASYTDLFHSILSQPGMTRKEMNKVNLLLIHFQPSLRPEYRSPGSHEPMQTYLAPFDCDYRRYWNSIWPSVQKIMEIIQAE